MKKTDLAYMAGLFDGEGTITLRKNGAYFIVVATLTMAVEYFPKWFKFSFGGNIYRPKKYNPQHSDCWKWTISGRQAALFVKEIYPYLILKRPQADVAMRFDVRDKHYRLTDGEKAIREAEAIVMRGLNKRGK